MRTETLEPAITVPVVADEHVQRSPQSGQAIRIGKNA
jgi:hypothetical protein